MNFKWKLFQSVKKYWKIKIDSCPSLFLKKIKKKKLLAFPLYLTILYWKNWHKTETDFFSQEIKGIHSRQTNIYVFLPFLAKQLISSSKK
jgi:hypothetical protein